MVQLSAQSAIQRILSDAVESGRTPGLIFGATSIENELFFAGAGPHIFGDPNSDPMTEDTVLWICSLSKIFASIAAFQLIEGGKLSLDTEVVDILPELANAIIVDASQPNGLQSGPPNGPILVKHLLNHTSGLDYGLEKNRPTRSHMPPLYPTPHDKYNPIKYFFDQRKGLYPVQPLKSEPGTSYAYGYGLDAVGFIVERISGQTLEEYYQKNIFEPLGIKSASFYLTPDLKKRLASLNYRKENGVVVPWDDQLPMIEQDPKKVHLHLTGGLFYCSAKDYLTVLRHILQIKAGIATNPILTFASVKTFFEPTLPPLGATVLNKYLKTSNQQWSTASCLTTVDMPGRRRKGSLWWFGWAGIYYVIDPESGVAFLLGSQLVPSVDPEIAKIWAQIEEIFYRELEVPNPKSKVVLETSRTSRRDIFECKL